jgi:hypothetical protein
MYKGNLNQNGEEQIMKYMLHIVTVKNMRKVLKIK